MFLKIDHHTLARFKNSRKIIQKNSRLLYLSHSAGTANLGIQISKKSIKLAVTRNKVRRIIRENFRSLQPSVGSYDLLFIISLKISSAKHELSDILMQEWISSIKLLSESQLR
ncbi:MAG: ribonuclease P protein component [Acidimicrobiaceae bacterium]|nr:ribonuclease P protein component [Acidimicrobiaceae bacterium]|tara:strand:- start:611 stop:949 length:339 start_codon:yes stop_codon:yes gene_type:complete